MVMTVLTEPLGKISKVLHCDDDVALGACSDMFFVLWRDRTTLDGIAKLYEYFDSFSDSRAKDIALITIVTNSAAKGPPSEVRRKLAGWLGHASERLLISAIVFEGNGFLAALVRGIATGLSIVAQPNCPHRVVPSVWHAGEWFQAATTGGSKIFRQNYVMARVGEFREAVPSPCSLHEFQNRTASGQTS
jgi:hypothetical protein